MHILYIYTHIYKNIYIDIYMYRCSSSMQYYVDLQCSFTQEIHLLVLCHTIAITVAVVDVTAAVEFAVSYFILIS